MGVGKVPLLVTGSPLDLVIGEGSDSLIISNLSLIASAANVMANLPSGWIDVMQNASDCANIAPNTSCTLVFTPGLLPHAAAMVRISGTNTKLASAMISVSASNFANLHVSPTTVDLVKDCPTAAEVTITNTSQTLSANNVHMKLGALMHYVEKSTDCPAFLPPQQKCTVKIVAKNRITEAKSVAINADNLTVEPILVNVAVRNTTLYSVSEDNEIIYSIDNGASWSNILPPAGETLTKVFVDSKGTTYAKMSNGNTMKSTNHGNTWSLVHNMKKFSNGMYLKNQNTHLLPTKKPLFIANQCIPSS